MRFFYAYQFVLSDRYGLTSYDAVRGSSGKGIASPEINAADEQIKGQNGQSLVFHPEVDPPWACWPCIEKYTLSVRREDPSAWYI